MNDSDRDSGTSAPTVEVTRRQLLKVTGGGIVGAGAARVGYEYIGFGRVTGTNLTEQSLGPLARRNLVPSPFTLQGPDHRVSFENGVVEVRSDTGSPIAAVSITDTESRDLADLPAPLEDLVIDLRAIETGEFVFEFVDNERFFDRIDDDKARPYTVAALRGTNYRRPSLETIEEFSGIDPAETEALVAGLADGFREYTHFDFDRYIASVIQRYLFFGAVAIRDRVSEPTHFDAILDGSSGLYCYEYALCSIEALHTVAPHRQSVPVFGAIVIDTRHNHAYTGLASVIVENGELRIPMTFVDYFYSTLFDTVRSRWAFGEGIDAFDTFHRATSIHYENRYGV